MAYFSNGSEGGVLDGQCMECLPHDPCPIAMAQAEFNYEQCDNTRLGDLLEMLIDQNGICQMKKYVSPRLTGKLFEDGTKLPFKTCVIKGSEIEFRKVVLEADLEAVVLDIWNHADKYSEFKADSDASYCQFLKFLWVEYPDGTERQLAAVANDYQE